jgi:hypothetical protein
MWFSSIHSVSPRLLILNSIENWNQQRRMSDVSASR